MIRYGKAPYLECSSRGDRRFSSYYAELVMAGGRRVSIEELYQYYKKFDDGDLRVVGDNRRRALNQRDADLMFSLWWNIYIAQRPELLKLLVCVSGLSDAYGTRKHACAVTELWRIRAVALGLRANIISPADHIRALREAEYLIALDPEADSIDGKRLLILAEQIQEYETRMFTF